MNSLVRRDDDAEMRIGRDSLKIKIHKKGIKLNKFPEASLNGICRLLKVEGNYRNPHATLFAGSIYYYRHASSY